MPHDGWTVYWFGFALNLVTTARMTHHLLHWIHHFPYSPNLCSICEDHSLYRCHFLYFSFCITIAFQTYFKIVGFGCFDIYWQVFNNSPDETAYFRMLLNRENISNAVVMIQPSLISYSFNSLPAPALLDVASISADRILLLDSYFSVVIFHGMTIAQWRNMGYHNQPEHQACTDFS